MNERDTIRDLVRQHLQPGITPEQSLILAVAEHGGQPLDAWSFDDAAVLLRAETLLREDVSLTDALATAREERATFADARTARETGEK